MIINVAAPKQINIRKIPAKCHAYHITVLPFWILFWCIISDWKPVCFQQPCLAPAAQGSSFAVDTPPRTWSVTARQLEKCQSTDLPGFRLRFYCGVLEVVNHGKPNATKPYKAIQSHHPAQSHLVHLFKTHHRFDPLSVDEIGQVSPSYRQVALQARARWQTAEFQPAPTSQPMLQPPQLSETRPWQMWQRLSRLSGSQETRAARGCFQRLEPKVSSKVARMSSKAPNHRYPLVN